MASNVCNVKGLSNELIVECGYHAADSFYSSLALSSISVSPKFHRSIKAVPGGTGITVLSLLLSNVPDISFLEALLCRLQVSHPILRSRVRFDASCNTFYFVTPSNPHVQIQSFDLQSTSHILQSSLGDSHIDSHHVLLEHELNRNSWNRTDGAGDGDQADWDVFFVSLYTISDTRWFLVFRLHTSACDRAAAVGLLRELLEMVGGGRAKAEEEIVQEVGIEDLIPSGKANKPLWARGVDLLGYSLNSFRLANLNFIDANSARHSQVVRLKMNPDDTDRLVAGCKSRGIKLCGALAAAGMIAARSTKPFPDHQKEKYAVVTLIDCRSILEPVLSSNHFGFYHSAILNTHDVTALDEVWELANRCYTSFSNAKNNNKHFSDMNDLNFLMCKAIDNPGLTPSSSMRTAFMSVFEDPHLKCLDAVGVEDRQQGRPADFDHVNNFLMWFLSLLKLPTVPSSLHFSPKKLNAAKQMCTKPQELKV
ncbi:hypothetical protein GOBAR_DD06942 [Gossypium barbadense]|nr:hypothetical protein GOBAR_DD06942 [Gossypium barbadense]